MLRSIAVASGLLAVLAGPLAGPLAAQDMEFAVSAFGGAYIPTGEIADVVTRGGSNFFDLEQKTSIALGGRASVWFSRLGVEAEGVYAFSNVDLPVSDEGAANVYMGSLNVLYTIFQAPFSPLSIHASAGGGLVSHSGLFYTNIQAKTDPAGVVGLGARFGVGPLANVRFDLRDYIYSFEPDAGGNAGSKLQNDILVTASVEFTFSPKP